jgi:linoleoyl-CoA desaturase
MSEREIIRLIKTAVAWCEKSAPIAIAARLVETRSKSDQRSHHQDTQRMRVTFTKNLGFRKEINKRVDAYFETAGIRPRDNTAMYFKTLTMFTWLIAAWTFVLFGPPIGWLKVIACMAVGGALAGIGFSVGHDANHGGYSSKKWVNSLVGLSYDFIIGASSYIWRYRHNYLHHTYTNIHGYDVEIHGDGLVRMTPHAEHRWYHRFQHIFIVFFYAAIPIYWSISDVRSMLFQRHYGEHQLPNPKAIDLLILLGGKLVWCFWFIGIPLLLGYSPLQVFLGGSIAYMTYGVVACHVFMLAHVLEPAQFIQPTDENNIEDEWAIFQVKTTVDFAPKNFFLNWYLGGLNYQVIHHLFPQICHIHYPNIAPIVAEVCREFEIPYHVYPTFYQALVDNYRWLQWMGDPKTALEAN